MKEINLDFETYSKVDLRKTGVHVYAEDPSTEVLMLAYSFDGGDVKQWVPVEFEDMPLDLLEALNDPKVVKRAHNAAFERAIFKHVLGMDIPVEQWRCSMVLGLSLSLPGSLDLLGKALRLPDEDLKMSRGKVLIRKFCTPRKPSKTMPHTRCNKFTDYEDWQEFKAYNIQDVKTELAALEKMKKWDLSDEEQEFYCLDQRVNDRGIPVNRAAVENAIIMVDDLFEDRIAKMKEITGLENPNSNQQLLPWLQENGYPYDDMVAGHIQKALEEAGWNEYHSNSYSAVLQMRSEISKSSVKKYASLQKGLSSDDTMKGAFQFNGASRTGRFSGRRFQPQNLAKAKHHLEDKQEEMARDLEVFNLSQAEEKYGDPVDLLSGAVRTVVQPGRGKMVVGADLNAIENRVLGWVCEDEKILDVFRKGKCPYVDFATYMFKEDYDVLYQQYKAGDKTKRTAAKPGVLGAGYRLGAGDQWEDEKTGEKKATGLLGYAWNMGVDMTEEMAQLSISTFRETYIDVVNYWYKLQEAARKCIQQHAPQQVGKISFDIQAPFLRMTLPSGRAIHYYKPRYENCMMPWGKKGMAITYEGLNDKNKWVRIQTHGGKLVENAVQAIARDILLHGMRNARKSGLDVFLHVHDEIVISSFKDEAEKDLETLKTCMTDRPSWARDLPLGAGGSITSCFVKD